MIVLDRIRCRISASDPVAAPRQPPGAGIDKRQVRACHA
jgi:hypothetical protein